MTGPYVTKLTPTDLAAYIRSGSLVLVERADRLQLLRQLGAVAIARDAEWTYARERAVNPWRFIDAPHECWSCAARNQRLYWHHVIEVQHGGPTEAWNVVALCYACHREVHPWLPAHALEAEWWQRVQPVRVERPEARVRFECLPIAAAPPGEIGELEPFVVVETLDDAKAEAHELIAQLRRGRGAARYSGPPYGVAIYACGDRDWFIEALRP